MTKMKTSEEILEERVNRPIAARLKAEPGWRIILFHPIGERVDGLQPVSIVIEPVKYWALDGPVMLPDSLDSMDFLFGGFFGLLSAPKTSAALWPLDANGKRYGKDVHRLVPPGTFSASTSSEETNEQLIESAKQWCAESVEKSKMTLSEQLAAEKEKLEKKPTP